MEITGKFVPGRGLINSQATIELTLRELLEQLTTSHIGELLNMINLPEPKQEFCKCKLPNKVKEDFRDSIHPYHCKFCHLPLHPEPKKEIDLISWSGNECLGGSDLILRKCVDKINEIINFLHRKE